MLSGICQGLAKSSRRPLKNAWPFTEEVPEIWTGESKGPASPAGDGTDEPRGRGAERSKPVPEGPIFCDSPSMRNLEPPRLQRQEVECTAAPRAGRRAGQPPVSRCGAAGRGDEKLLEAAGGDG